VSPSKAKGRNTATDGETAPADCLGGNTAEAYSKHRAASTVPVAPSEPGGLAARRFGAWTAVRTDQTGRRVTVICRCGIVRLVALDALLSGASTGCGCSATPTQKAAPTSRPPSNFASRIAEAETITGHGRHKGRT
jgi:hypothetical protein